MLSTIDMPSSCDSTSFSRSSNWLRITAWRGLIKDNRGPRLLP